jgi:hypothetical protein
MPGHFHEMLAAAREGGNFIPTEYHIRSILQCEEYGGPGHN